MEREKAMTKKKPSAAKKIARPVKGGPAAPKGGGKKRAAKR